MNTLHVPNPVTISRITGWKSLYMGFPRGAACRTKGSWVAMVYINLLRLGSIDTVHVCTWDTISSNLFWELKKYAYPPIYEFPT